MLAINNFTFVSRGVDPPSTFDHAPELLASGRPGPLYLPPLHSESEDR